MASATFHQQDRLTGSIALSLVTLFIIHLAVSIVVTIQLGLPLRDSLAFSAILFIHHLAIMLILSHMLHFFVYTGSGTALHRINIPIFITLCRLTSLPVIIYLIILLEEHSVLELLIAYTVFAFITDFLDGNISRRMKQTTKIGAYLDSISDYAVLISISIAYIIYELLPDWFFILVMLRLFFQWAAAAVMTVMHQKMQEHSSSLLAKASIFGIMTMYAAALIRFIPALSAYSGEIISVLEWIVSPVLVLSLIEKIYHFIFDLRNALRSKSDRSNPDT
ncbi:CDP-alcohol phosphatidyltransferase family protein [Salinispira pacifica]|uniref:CDP-alcohol phosphatidyltransferase n=1 Tax=Salinispira pacifica TaxID=1307761 RepID=V5WD73_9SPIO|nr:CDP-alcohol phosphatidyltransferase family protein [Salinispira pacifica]AHC13778.1 CDP-alcohol phosphatidyltransferase [Salinispira pacifica]